MRQAFIANSFLISTVTRLLENKPATPLSNPLLINTTHIISSNVAFLPPADGGEHQFLIFFFSLGKIILYPLALLTLTLYPLNFQIVAIITHTHTHIYIYIYLKNPKKKKNRKSKKKKKKGFTIQIWGHISFWFFNFLDFFKKKKKKSDGSILEKKSQSGRIAII